MARLEVPSIVVHSGSPSVPGSMERPHSLRKQKSSLDEGEAGGCIHHSSSLKHDPGGSPPGPSINNNNNNNNSESNDGDPAPAPATPAVKSAPSSETESAGGAGGAQPQLSRSRSQKGMKMLTRSHAMREATSPPPDPSAAPAAPAAPAALAAPASSSPAAAPTPPTPTSNGKGGKHKEQDNSPTTNMSNFRQKTSSSQNYSAENWPPLPAAPSSNTEPYQETSGVDLEVFIAQTVASNRNRHLILRIEDELRSLALDPNVVFFQFPPMSSFHRMVVHRAAAFFGLDHNLNKSGNSVIVNRTKNTRVPEKCFLDIFKEHSGLYKGQDIQFYEEPRRSILKRDCASFEDSPYKSDEKQLSLEARRSKSFEEREEEYKKARKRIFSRDDSSESRYRSSDSVQDSMDELQWNEVARWGSNEPEPPGRYLRPNDRSSSHFLKGESFESCDSLKTHPHRSSVSKSHSFGGYTGNASPRSGQSYSTLQRGDSSASSHSNSSRMLAKQDSASSASSRVSPSSSGYKSQSQQSDATLSATPSPTATPVSHLGPKISQMSSQGNISPEPAVIWPMATMGNIPSGSVLINPATGQPICNADGTVYRYDPDNPLKLQLPASGSASPRGSPRLDEKEEPPAERSALKAVQEGPPSHPGSCSSSASSTSSLGKPSCPDPEPPKPSLPVPEVPRHLTNAATSPLPSVASPHRPVPAQAGQPLVLPPQSVPVSYSSGAGQPQTQQMMPVMSQVPGGAGVFSHPYANGPYVQGYTTSADGQTYVNGYPYMAATPTAAAPAMPPVNGYMEPSYVAQAHGCPPPQGSCCVPGYVCPYNGQVAAPAGPPYEQRNNSEAGGVSELSNYMMSMNLMEQRGGGDGVPCSGPGPARPGGQSPAHQAPGVMASPCYWGPHLSSHTQGYPSVMFYLPPASGASSAHSAAPPTVRNSSNNSGSPGSGGRARNVAASYAKGAAIYQAPLYTMPSMPHAQAPPDRPVLNGYPSECIPVGVQQPVVYPVPTSMHSGTMQTQQYQPALYSTASTPGTPTGSVVPNGVSFYSGGPGAGDGPSGPQGQPPQAAVPMSPYGGAHGYIPAVPTPPLTPNPMLGAQGAYGMPHPYMYNVYSQHQASSGPAGPPGPNPVVRGVMRPSMVVQSSPPPRSMGPKGFPRGQSPSGPVARKEAPGPGSGDQIRFSQSYPVPMFNLTPRYMSGDMRYMGRLPFSIPSNYRAIRPFQPPFFPRPHSQGEALSLSRPPRVRKPTSYGPPRRQPFDFCSHTGVKRPS